MSIFARYLLFRFWHVFTITFVALLGLYVIIDVFTNADDFLHRDGGAVAVMSWMLEYYAYRSSLFFETIGGTAAVIAALVGFSLMQRHGELNPILSAGVCAYRLVVPILWGMMIVNLLLIANQELVIPRIAHMLEISPGKNGDIREDVEPVYDLVNKILISGRKLHLSEQKLEGASFLLPVPRIADELTTIEALHAVYHYARGNRPNGWLLYGWTVKRTPCPLASLRLTEKGRKIVLPGDAPNELFIVTDVSFDRLFKRDRNFEYLSTWELVRRVKNPSFGVNSIRSQSLYLNSRFTRPIFNLIMVLLGFPLVVRKESKGLITNLALCALAMGAAFGINQLYYWLGRANICSTDWAAWAPVIICGTASAWFSGFVRT